jgi:hypothetical protein
MYVAQAGLDQFPSRRSSLDWCEIRRKLMIRDFDRAPDIDELTIDGLEKGPAVQALSLTGERFVSGHGDQHGTAAMIARMPSGPPSSVSACAGVSFPDET